MKTCLLQSLILSFLFSASSAFSQSNVRAWYADGQVFVIWTYDMPIEESYTIYASPAPFTSTSSAILIGRSFFFEYAGYGLKENLMDSTATYKIPDGNDGKYQLTLNEGLFVFTPHQSGSLYFAVTKFNSNVVAPGQNITDAVPFTYDPVNDPVECHLQRTFLSPFTSDYLCFAYSMWSDGRQNHWEGRPDFPIMANEYKNGMPSVFLVSAPFDLDTTVAFPLSVWLHGGGGLARQSLAGSRAELNIDPEIGILVAHDDKMYGYRGAQGPHPDQPTWHFGYRKNYDPFSTSTEIPPDSIINYTQRRYLWVDHWLSKNFNVDTNRINIHGHSMGSAGALALAKCFPRHYGSATIYNTGCSGPDSISNTIYIFGTRSNDFRTNLKNRNGDAVRFYDLWDLYTNTSSYRDIPLIRHWHGKNDNNGVMHWGPVVIENFRICDSIGTGIQNYWSERPHGMDMAPLFNDHWIKGIPADQQTVHDNVSFPEAHHKSNESFPAFFNHRLDAKNNDPGTGLIGINNGDGDNWGTWGGYHRWTILDEQENYWQAVAWLENTSEFENDKSPEAFLTADVAIRRPQAFKPATGQALIWRVEDFLTGNFLQGGTAVVGDDSLVTIPQINVYRSNVRRVRISIANDVSAVKDGKAPIEKVLLFPNPANDFINLDNDWREVTVFDVNGIARIHIANNSTQPFLNVSTIGSGNYFIEIITKDGDRKIGRFVKN